MLVAVLSPSLYFFFLRSRAGAFIREEVEFFSDSNFVDPEMFLKFPRFFERLVELFYC